jgi:hypothetical protein
MSETTGRTKPRKRAAAAATAEARLDAAPASAPEGRGKKIKQPPILFEATQAIIARLEQRLGRTMLVYWNSQRGNVCNNDVLALFELFKRVGRTEKAALLIKSNGGNIEAALRIVNLLREYAGHIVALVPLESASAATIIALGADVIEMGPLAHLTAIDSSLRHDLSPITQIENSRVSVSQDELARIVKLWNRDAREHHANPYSDLFKYIHPLVVGAIDRSSSLSEKICAEVLSYHLPKAEDCERISRSLNSDYPSHSYPITAREAVRLGLDVKVLDGAVNDLLLDLNHLYSEMAQPAVTDFDKFSHHDNEIINIVEAAGTQIYFQNDKDWNYIEGERRWQTMNDESSWRQVEMVDGVQRSRRLHIR